MYYEDETVSDIPKPKDVPVVTNVAASVRKPYPKDIAEAQGMNPPIDYWSKYSSFLQTKRADANIYDEDPISAIPPQSEPLKRNFSTSGETPDMAFDTKTTNQVKTAAKEHGMEEHKGKTIPKEVKSLADRIRKKEPGKSDEYAYRTAWDIFRSHTAEGKSYPHKSPESGLAREGGGTGPLSKKASSEEKTAFQTGFEKKALMGDTLGRNIAGDIALGQLVPFGTTVGTAFGKRPEGHDRMKEWRARMGGSIAGSLLLGPIGGAVGEGLASSRVMGKYYGKDGKLKPEIKKQLEKMK